MKSTPRGSNESLTIGILSFGNQATLEHSIHSWREGGLLDFADEIIVFFNAITRQDKEIARKNRFICIGNSKNIGIGFGIEALINKASCDYFLFLENDWDLIESRETTLLRLRQAKELLQESVANCIRLRHARAFGSPLHSYQFRDNPLKSPECLMDSVHYLEDPSKSLPNHIFKIQKLSEDWFVADSAYANYTNNPCLYKTSFLKQILSSPRNAQLSIEARKVVSAYADAKKLKAEHIQFESLIQHHWKNSELRVAQGSGLFMHHPLASSGSKSKLIKPLSPGTQAYDLIFSLGYGCSCSHHLRKSGLQGASYPYDWVLNKQSIQAMAAPFLNNFRSNFCVENIVPLQDNHPKSSIHYIDKITNVVSVHDFSKNADFKSECIEFTSKQKRRANRLIKEIEAKEKILIVYEDPSNRFYSIEFSQLLEKLDKRFPGKQINILHIQYRNGFTGIKFEIISPRIFHASFDNSPDQVDPKDSWTGNSENWSELLSRFSLLLV